MINDSYGITYLDNIDMYVVSRHIVKSMSTIVGLSGWPLAFQEVSLSDLRAKSNCGNKTCTASYLTDFALVHYYLQPQLEVLAQWQELCLLSIFHAADY